MAAQARAARNRARRPGAGPHPDHGVAAGGPHQGNQVAGHLRGHPDLGEGVLGGHQLLREVTVSRPSSGMLSPQGEEHPPLLLRGRVAHGEADEKAVHLGGGEAEGALRLHRVLGGHHHKGGGEGKGLAVDGDLPLFHGLQQGGLSAGDRPVDLVGQQQIGEHGAGQAAELPRFRS